MRAGLLATYANGGHGQIFSRNGVKILSKVSRQFELPTVNAHIPLTSYLRYVRICIGDSGVLVEESLGPSTNLVDLEAVRGNGGDKISFISYVIIRCLLVRWATFSYIS